jgi:predicted anti-sigma-YlaC factor YlaD
MTCAELVEVVTDYLEGDLCSCDASSLEQHIEECFGCRVYLDQMRETVRLLRSLPPGQPSSGDADRLLEIFRRAKGQGD